MALIDWVNSYIERGFFPIPIEPRSKICRLSGWQSLRSSHEDVPRLFNNPELNVGILLGDASNGIVDVDLDCLEAITLSHYLLPPTDMVFGRDSKPASHWIYRVPNAGKTEKFLDPDGGTLVELRSNGCYTVFPGSTHESGEEIRFYADDEPATIELGYLAACARHLAAASLILPHWLQGQRHSLALALSGILLRNGFGEEEAHQFIDAFVCASGDQESEDRHWCVRSTAINLKAGKAC